ncbi:hypothetical protein C8D94_103410 [Marinirhabdus gelatinilytica]|uniref:Uncharacterized protein n=1 Tax=Marinirhabdus gelatinilytica TaxID=1703343 RepID=A0A370QB34_9FLAO|nr:hypothetical protein C8D94_103410 [Marinirhabdus gelatinilytica]
MLANGFAYDPAGFERQLRQCQHPDAGREWEAQRANQPLVSDELFLREEDIGAATTYFSA